MKPKNAIFLALTAFIFGISFIAQDEAAEHVGPFTFNCARFAIAFVVLFATALIADGVRKKTGHAESVKKADKTLLLGGLLCGLALGTAVTCQQIGLADPNMTSGKAGFISACYIIIVPLLGLPLRRRPTAWVWPALALAIGGLYLLCLADGFSLSWGDIVMAVCALMIAVHIMLCDYFAPRCDSLKLTCAQCAVIAVVSLPLMFAFDTPDIAALGEALPSLLFCGVLASGAAYTFQMIGQVGANPTLASMIMSFESVIAAIAGALVLGQEMTAAQIAGCAVIFAAVIIAQLPGRRKKEVTPTK